jgi:hypothetical protein
MLPTKEFNPDIVLQLFLFKVTQFFWRSVKFSGFYHYFYTLHLYSITYIDLCTYNVNTAKTNINKTKICDLHTNYFYKD